MPNYSEVYKKNEEELNLYLIKESFEKKKKSSKKIMEDVKRIFGVTKTQELEDILWQGNGYEKEWFSKAICKIKKDYMKELGKYKLGANTKITKKLQKDINDFIEAKMYSASADIITAYEKKHGEIE